MPICFLSFPVIKATALIEISNSKLGLEPYSAKNTKKLERAYAALCLFMGRPLLQGISSLPSAAMCLSNEAWTEF